ncbi:MAG: septum formation initiator family protein [Brachybacterium sp.]|uniref:septum formation initiator family protein n=1 Tax=Brachybacterium sp. TaxID=1891286 RepID=UPI0026482230|nr:septum formation initiator family protein [Brachybacterium sp.]MDN5687172.1 septum formation initiator family protein [Brachybacterium sp.]
MSSRRPGAPRSARRPVSASGARRPGAGPASRASTRSGSSRGGVPEGSPSRSRSRGPAPASRPRSTAPRGAEEDGPGITITRRTLALVALVVIALAALVPTINSYVAQRQQLSELQTQVEKQEQDVQTLREQVARWEDPAFVAARARERLLFAMPGETQYRLTDTSGQDVPLTEAEQAAEKAQEGEWFSTLWKSVEGAGRLTPEDIPDETGSTDEDVPEEDPADTTDQDPDQ